jgi:solute:Na+ symporter, SSS family
LKLGKENEKSVRPSLVFYNRKVNIKTIDWFIAAVLLTALIVLGVSIQRYARSVADFLVAGRKVRKYLGLGSQRSEGIGLSGIAASAQQGFQHGFSYLWISVINKIWGIPLFGIIGFGTKRFRATKCMTTAQYLEERYQNKYLRLAVGIVLAFSGVINMAIFPKVGADFLIAFTNLPSSFQLTGFQVSTALAAMITLLSLAVFFTFLGGMITVVITDFVQSVILIGAIVFIGIFSLIKLGPANIHHTLESNLGQGAYNPFSAGSYGLTWFLWIVCLGIFIRFAFAPQVQRMASSDSPETVRKMDLINNFMGSGQSSLQLLLGIGALVLFGASIPTGTDAETYHRFVAAIYMRQTLPTIAMGLTLAALLFASISTIDSYLLSWATVIVNDILMPLRKKSFSSKGHILAIRVTTIAIAIAMLLWSFGYKANESIMEYMYLTGTIMAGIGISVLFGLYWKKANAAGSYASLAICVLGPMSDLIGKQFIANYPLSTQQSGLFSILAAIAAMVIVSLITGKGTSPGWIDYGKVVKSMDAEEKARLEILTRKSS